MKINEIILEDTSAEEQLGSSNDKNGEDSLTTNLMPVLMFLKKRSEDKELSAKLRTDSLIQLVQNAGDTTFDYNALVDAYENNDSVKELIKTFNKDTIELMSDSDKDSDEEHGAGSGENDNSEDHTSPEQNPEETVSQMAKKAAKNRQ